MADDLHTIVQRMIDAGESEENIATVVQHFKASAPQTPTAEPGYLSQVGHRFVESVKHVAGDPSVGATLASLAATPFTAGMSVLPAAATMFGAGALGAAPAALAKGDPMAIAKEGAGAALGEAGGRALAAGASGFGKLMYKASLRPSMALQREFGDVAQTGLDEGAAVGDSGLKKITGRLQMSADKAKQMIADAEAAGAPGVAASDVTPQFGGVLKQAERQLDLGRLDPRPDVWNRIMSFNERHPADIPLSRAQELKTEAQDLASRAYRAADRGGPMTDLSSEGDKAMASGLRQGIEARVPGIADVNSHTQDLIGIQRAVEDATRRNVPGVGSIRTLLGDFAPNIASRLGIGLHAAGQSATTPDAFRTALLAALGVGGGGQ